jgi:Na+/H+ antiporter NhaA
MGFLVIALFYETKISTVNMKVQMYSKFILKISNKIKISKLHEERKISHYQV